jgi:hypothetical protein
VGSGNGPQTHIARGVWDGEAVQRLLHHGHHLLHDVVHAVGGEGARDATRGARGGRQPREARRCNEGRHWQAHGGLGVDYISNGQETDS